MPFVRHVVWSSAGRIHARERRWECPESTSESVEVTAQAVRPHTAHGIRATSGLVEVLSSQAASGWGGEASPVVAGARGMMR